MFVSAERSRFLFRALSAGVLAVFFGASSFAFAAESPQSQPIQTFLETVKSMDFPVTDAAAHESRVKAANAYLDLEAMGRKGLGAHWDAASPEDRRVFVELLWKLIENIAYPRTKKFMTGKEVAYADAKPLEKGFEVESIVKGDASGLDVPIVYDVAEENGEWKIYDIFLDGISITEDLGYQFDKLIQESEFAGLLQRMRERLAEAEKETRPR